MKNIKQAGVAGILVASLAAANGVGLTPRLSARAASAIVYQNRLGFLARVLETSPAELERQLSELAHGNDLSKISGSA